MTAGLPGTGIGSLFYVLLTVWMPFRELFALAQGRSSWKRWGFIGWQWAMLAAIIVSVFYFWELLYWGYVQVMTLATGYYEPDTQTSTLTGVALYGGFITLALVITAVFVMRSVVRRRNSRGTIRTVSRLQPTLAASALRDSVGLEAAK